MPAQNNQTPDNHQPTTPQPDANNQTPDQSQTPNENQTPDQNQNQQPTAPPPPPQADNLSDIRGDLNIPHEGLTTPDPAHQQDLENAHPKNPDGTPQVFADPRQGNWAGLQNDGGPGVPGRSNNCADCTRSFLETWFGRPTVSAPRTLDTNPDGSLNRFSAERNSVENQERWAGAPSTYAGSDHPNPYARIAHELTQAGHGSAAMIAVNWPGGGGHAFAAVNHNGQVLFVDPQTGVVSETPIHQGAKDVFYTPLDANRNPITPYFLQPSTPQPSTENTPDTTNNTSGTDTSTPAPQSSDPNPDQASEPTTTPDSDTPQQPEATADTDQDTQDTNTDEAQNPDDSTDQHQDSTEPTQAPTPSTATRPSGPPDGYDDPTDADNRAQQERFPRDEDGSFQRAPDPREGSWLDDIRGQNPDDSGRDVNCPDGALAFADSYAGNPTVAARRSPNEDGTPADTPEPGGRDRIESTLGAEFDDFGDGRDAYDNLETTLLNEGHGSQAVIITQNADGRAHAWNVVNHNGQIVYADPQTGQSSTTPLHSGNNGVFAIPLDANRRPLATTPQSDDQSTSTPARPAGTSPDSSAQGAEATRAQRNQSLPDPEAKDQEHANLPPDQAQRDLRGSHNVRRIDLDPVQAQMRRWAEPTGTPPRSPLSELLRESLDRRQAHAESARHVRATRHDYDRAQKEVSAATAARTRAKKAEENAKTDEARQAAHKKRVEAEQRLAQAMQILGPAETAHKAAMEAHRNVPMPSTSFTDSTLRNHLDPAWSQMNDGERYASIAAMARISQSFHANNAVGSNPRPATDNDAYGDGQFHESAAAWRREESLLPEGTLPQGIEDIKRLVEAAELDSPDLTGKNYAVVEVFDPETNESHFIVDSSVPAGVDGATPAHSESHILKWIDDLNANLAPESQVKIKGLFTEREPCGLPTSTKTGPDGKVSHHPTGHANCSRTINESKAMDRVPVYYGTTYRADPDAKDLKAAEPDRLRDEEGLTPSQVRTAMRNYRTPSQTLQDAEFNEHLNFVDELVQTLAPQRQPSMPPPAPGQSSPPIQEHQAGPQSPGEARRPSASPAGTSNTSRTDSTPAPTADVASTLDSASTRDIPRAAPASGGPGEHDGSSRLDDGPRESSPAPDRQSAKRGRLQRVWQAMMPTAPAEPTESTTEVDHPSFYDEAKLPERQPDSYGRPLDRPDGTRMPLFDGPPLREQTQQGSIGDCGVIATMGAVASRYPDLLQDMIRETEDGNYEVRFHEAARSNPGGFAPTGRILTVRVTPELPIYSDFPHSTVFANAHAMGVAWPAIMEKAIAGLDQFWDEETRENKLLFAKNRDSDKNLLTGYSRLTRGTNVGERAELLAQITGRATENHEFPTQYDMNGRSRERQVLDHLRELLDSGRPVLIGTQQRGEGVENRMEKNLRSEHVYEIVSVDDRGLIQLRNPHNSDQPDPLTAKELMKYCRDQYTTLKDGQ
ncbi:toxin glutamine deamidase domain-containing protein [Streptomyces sp. NPDC006422]|uniref:toxin glutamine deamidase domain-containing protein n=1 Tax=unclassified Streptomyces TaxID=2593676 RepID=UPI0033BC08D5